MSTLTRRGYLGPFTDIFGDWPEVPVTRTRPMAGQTIRAEDYVKDDRYVLRAELPGVDPEKDLEVTASGGILTIKADRHDETEGTHRSEFRYGTLARSILLPANADEAHIQASYDNGVLKVIVPLKSAGQDVRHIPVMLNKHIKPT